MPQHIFLCEPGWEKVAAAEAVREIGGACEVGGPGWLVLTPPAADEARTPCIAFARQCLPNAVLMQAASIRKWVEALTPEIIRGLASEAGPWRLHVISNPVPGGTAGPRRCSLIRSGLLDALKRKQKRLLPLLSEGEPVDDDTATNLVQVGLVDAVHGWLSILPTRERRRWRRVVSAFAAGQVEAAEDKRAPSRAFRKLVEALVRMGESISEGDNCVDLGSSPGGWTYVALNAGAIVTAIDRSPLASELMEHPRLRFVKGDAFNYRPDAPVDWLLSDVVAFPDRIIELLDRWLKERLCRRFVATVKFRGADDHGKLQELKRLLEANAADFQIRRLNANKNEVTAFGWLVR